MHLHASCAARPGPLGSVAVLLCGPSGSGKSDLLLRLLQTGFVLVADDRVIVEDGLASAPPALAGLLEVRGLGVFRLEFISAARVVLAVNLGIPGERLPLPEKFSGLDVPLVTIDPFLASAPARVGLALDAATGRVAQLTGAFAA